MIEIYDRQLKSTLDYKLKKYVRLYLIPRQFFLFVWATVWIVFIGINLYGYK
jgi:uncharacterized membrane protein